MNVFDLIEEQQKGHEGARTGAALAGYFRQMSGEVEGNG